MKTIPTAEDYFDEFLHERSHVSISLEDSRDWKEMMIEFAKLHVEAALKEVHNNAVKMCADTCHTTFHFNAQDGASRSETTSKILILQQLIP